MPVLRSPFHPALSRTLGLAAVVLGLATACQESSAPPVAGAQPLGLAIAQTGNASLFGQEQLAGLQIAKAVFERPATGVPIDFRVQDSGSDEASAINAFQTLINVNEVVAIIGPTLSQQAFGADPIAERAGVPVLAASNTAKGIPELGQFIVRLSAPASVVAPQAIAAARKLNPQAQRVVVVYAQDDAYSRSETEVFQKAVKDAGLNLALVQRYQVSDSDFQGLISQALQQKPDIIVLSSLAADGGNLVRQLRELGYSGLIVGGNGFNTPNVFPVCQQRCDGIIVAQTYSPNFDSPVNKDFRQRYEAQFGKQPSQFSAQIFSAVQVIAESLNRVNQQQPVVNLPLPERRKALLQAMLSSTYETPLGRLSFTPGGEVNQEQFYVARIRMKPDGQGDFELLP
ncbi:ABC transporter substrate-binding protein [Synechococcus elongatus]|uniref:ABC transporter substrate-binding protein n=1 Tax=Synechococcus elongatus PCC 11802 TaxID=2283154 RepID=A0AAT9JYP6_SYNEL|nr:ABC transporter substrate-binding protein [Synechococcus elongatus]QFZ91597.1 branched-chain amino acid ABC transporter substrate-binding protein [Synechococcus elongatus PCC 11802]